jgi:hypothetical protein
VCQTTGEALSAVIFWETHWRPDQKDLSQREAAAQQGIENFFKTTGCFKQLHLVRQKVNKEDFSAVMLAMPFTPQRIVTLVVRELGPVLKLFASPALINGGTEVVLDIQAYAMPEAKLLADFSAHWENGGAGVIKGVATLTQDMQSALNASLNAP